MTELGRKCLRALAQTDASRLAYSEHCLSFDRIAYYNDGRVIVWGIGTLPLFWVDRRSIRRAVARIRRQIESDLIREALDARAAKARKP